MIISAHLAFSIWVLKAQGRAYFPEHQTGAPKEDGGS